MTKRYHVIACDVISQELRHFAATDQPDDHLTFAFLEQGLHNTPDILRQTLQDAIDRADGEGYSSILLGYGLCGNGLAGVQVAGDAAQAGLVLTALAALYRRHGAVVGAELLEVGPGAERPAARSRQERHPQLGIVPELSPGVA